MQAEPKPAASASALEELRGLLLGPERSRELDEVRERVLHEPARAEDVAAVLPEAVTAGYAQNRKLVAALQKPVAECLTATVRDDPQPLVDALFPIIGPAIRRSISETLRGFTESLNRTIEYSFSIKGLKWRLEAMRSGVPFAEVVLRHTLRYRVDEAFLIHRGTGLLIAHAAQPEVEARDNDAVSGMLTAIQDFAQDAFRAQNRLQEVTLGEHLLWIFHGPDAMLVCAIRGVPDASARTAPTEALERIQRDYRAALADFSGDASGFAGVQEALRECLLSEQKNGPAPAAVSAPAADQRLFTPARVFMLVAVLVGIGLGVWTWQAREARGRFEDYVATLRAMPGYVVSASGKRQGRWYVEGLRDPLASEPGFGDSGLDAEQVSTHWTPYLSLDPVLVERRARAQLRAPKSVSAYVDDGVLVLDGPAPQDWIAAVRGSAFLPPGITRLDTSRLVSR